MTNDAKLRMLTRLIREEKLYKLKENLHSPSPDVNPNYRYLFNALKEQRYEDNKLIAGSRGVVLEGSSRSGKTYSAIDFIIYLCLYVEKNAVINIYRQTYAEHKTTTYSDFKKRLDDYGLDNPFHDAKEVRSFKINGNTITFLGCDQKQGIGSDYTFFNEVIFIDQKTFDQASMRVRKFWFADLNPSVTVHYIYNEANLPDVGYLRTTYQDNPFISSSEKNKILSYEPWQSESYTIEDEQVYYMGEPVSETNQPPPHPINVTNGTASSFMWRCYGLGLRGALDGVIFPIVNYVDTFPYELGFIYGLDFGFTVDPCALTRVTEDKYNIYIEPLLYTPIDNPDTLAAAMVAVGVEQEDTIICDSSDRYAGHNGVIEMAASLRDEFGYDNLTKVHKTKTIMHWLGSMKTKRINIVKNDLYTKARAEFENYRLMEIQGIKINKPIDKDNHLIDSARYAHIALNSQIDMSEEHNQ